MGGTAFSEPFNWSSIRDFLPFDLDTLAVETGCLKRRRKVEGGESLLRTMLLYGLPKSSLQRSVRLAREANLSDMSAVALFKRLCKSERLLQGVFTHLLSHAATPEERFGPYRLLAVDATVLCGPGATGTDQRLHVVYDLGKGLPLSVDLTDAKGGESLKRHHSFGQGDLILADRAYGVANSLLAALRSKARFLVRFEFESIRLLDDLDEKIWPEQAEGCVPATGQVQICVHLPEWPAPLRAIAERNPEGKPIWLITDLGEDELPLSQVRALYARRWQIELFFKRLKSLLELDELPTRAGPTARPWIWTKLILSTLAVLTTHERFSPWGRPLPPNQSLDEFQLRSDHPGRSPADQETVQTQKREASRKKTKTQSAKTTLPVEAFRTLS
jgi:hypothetical protein